VVQCDDGKWSKMLIERTPIDQHVDDLVRLFNEMLAEAKCGNGS
jgi:hypothetical protein